MVSSQGFILLFTVCFLLGASQGKTIVVGGPEHWHFGYNYTEWAIQSGPFYINDALVFKYDPPSHSNMPYSVYLLPDLWSYMTCDFSRAKLLAGPMQGRGHGFEIVLNNWRPYYFACGERNGYNCKAGMKFFAAPWPRWNI